MEYRHCKYTITGAYVCDNNKKVETFANLAKPSTKKPAVVTTAKPVVIAATTAAASASFSCPNYARMTSGQKQDAACVVLKRYNTKEVNDYFACSARDPIDGIPTCKNKNIISTCVPADKRLMECNRCCPSVDPNAPPLTRESMQRKREACMLDCKKEYDAASLVVKSSEVKVDPSLKADPKCIGDKQRQTQCYTANCKSEFSIMCVKAGRTLEPPTAPTKSSGGSATADINCTNACKKRIGCDFNDKVCTGKCNQQCIKAGYVAAPVSATKSNMSSSASAKDATKMQGKGHTCTGVCKKKPGCSGMDCDMMCEFNCAY
jgi:hypothetical protein